MRFRLPFYRRRGARSLSVLETCELIESRICHTQDFVQRDRQIYKMARTFGRVVT